MNSDRYDICIDPNLEKAIKKNLPSELKKVLDSKIKYLSENFCHPSLNTKQLNLSQRKLKQLGVSEVWEFRINMSYRCVYYLLHTERMLVVAFVGNHEKVKKRYC